MNRKNIISLFLCATFCSMKFSVTHVTKFNVLPVSVQNGWGVETELFVCVMREERSHNTPHCYVVVVPLWGVWLCSTFCLQLEITNVLSVKMAKHISTYLLPLWDVCSFLRVVNYVSEVLAERFIPMEYTELFPSGRITSDLLGMCRFYYGRNRAALTDTARGVRWFL
jgi:hypothetical protein